MLVESVRTILVAKTNLIKFFEIQKTFACGVLSSYVQYVKASPFKKFIIISGYSKVDCVSPKLKQSYCFKIIAMYEEFKKEKL